MKKIITIFVLLINCIVFSQEKKTVSSGYITFNSNSTVYFKNMTIDAENVIYFTEASQKMTYSLSGVKKIVDNYGNLIYQSDKETEAKKAEIVEYTTKRKTEQEKLVYKSSSKILMNGKKLDDDDLEQLFLENSAVHYDYKKGKNGATIGSIMMGGGLGLFLGGELSNLASAKSGSNTQGSPAILIAGIAIGVVGIPVRIVGVSNLKKAVREYNELSAREISFLQKSEFKIIAGVGSVGLQWQF